VNWCDSKKKDPTLAVWSSSFADCFALASALERKATIVTGDPEFRKVEHLVGIIWIE
jgi:predicted nucleic acid-binding protein